MLILDLVDGAESAHHHECMSVFGTLSVCDHKADGIKSRTLK